MRNLFLNPLVFDRKSFVADIVAADHRAADVFRKYGISYCCGGKWPLDMVCEMKGLDIENLQAELEIATRNIMVSNHIDFAGWDTALLIGYITGVHHRYLRSSLPHTGQMLFEFIAEHNRKYTRLDELEGLFKSLDKHLHIAMEIEEEVLFPYIKQLDNAHRAKESYASLLVRTLRKPVEDSLSGSHRTIRDLVLQIRELTDQYTPPANACVSHKVVMAKLKELDNDLAQHLYLEDAVLYTRTMAMEKELLGK